MKVTTMDPRKRSIALETCNVRCIPHILSRFEDSTFLKQMDYQVLHPRLRPGSLPSIRSANILKRPVNTSAHSRSVLVANISGPVALSSCSPRRIFAATSSVGTGSLSCTRVFWLMSRYTFCYSGISVYFAANFSANRLAFAVGSKTQDRESDFRAGMFEVFGFCVRQLPCLDPPAFAGEE